MLLDRYFSTVDELLAKVRTTQRDAIIQAGKLIAEATGLLTGHTIKHLLATAAAAIIVARLTWRSRPAKA